MALPKQFYRGDIVVMVAWDKSQPSVFTNFCGAKGISLNINNEILSEKVGDCDDWSAAVQTVKSYGAQNITMNFDGTWAKGNHTKVLKWVLEQQELPVRIHFVGVQSGDIEYIDGLALASEIGGGGIGNLDGAAVTRNLNIEFSGGIEITEKS